MRLTIRTKAPAFEATITCMTDGNGCETHPTVSYYMPTKADCHALAKHVLKRFGRASYVTDDQAPAMPTGLGQPAGVCAASEDREH